jgi:hypothetical protein
VYDATWIPPEERGKADFSAECQIFGDNGKVCSERSCELANNHSQRSFSSIGSQSSHLSVASGFEEVADNVLFLRGELAGETSQRHSVLRASLQDPSLNVWHLGKNHMGDRGAAIVSKALRKSTKLDLLGMGHNSITDSGIHKIADAMARSKAPLRVVCLANNNIGDHGAAALAAAIPFCPELEVLDLRSNSIGPEGAKRLAEALRFGGKLKRLQLGGNQVGDEGAEALAAAWPSSLEELALEDSGISDVGAASLAGALKSNSTLLLCGNDISAAGKRSIRAARNAITRSGFCCTVGM